MPKPFRLTAPEPLEHEVHASCADALDKLLMAPAVWFTYPAGVVQLSAQQAAQYSRLGLRRGLPDIWILHFGVYCIELKRRGGRLSESRMAKTRRGSPRFLIGQADMFPRLLLTGAVKEIAICHNVDEMLDQLQLWNIPIRSRVTLAPKRQSVASSAAVTRSTLPSSSSASSSRN